MSWSSGVLAAFAAADEIEIAVVRASGALGRFTPIWVVVADDGVFVRTWYARETGWYGGVQRTGRARVRVGGVERAVRVVRQLGSSSPVDESLVDAAYWAKYSGEGLRSVVTPAAVETTLELLPEE